MNKVDQYTRITDLLSEGQFFQGAEMIENARGDLPLPVFLECVGNLHFYKREFQKAIEKYEEAINADTSYGVARYHYLVGVQKERERNYVEAFKRYQAAIEIEATFADAYVELGGLLVKAEDYVGALTCYTDALRLDPTDLKNFWNRVQVLKRLENIDMARYGKEYRKALDDYEKARVRLPPVDEPATW
jgi:tetratricopeptide (TPR) repeat protein